MSNMVPDPYHPGLNELQRQSEILLHMQRELIELRIAVQRLERRVTLAFARSDAETKEKH
jgi:hypothetical protein